MPPIPPHLLDVLVDVFPVHLTWREAEGMSSPIDAISSAEHQGLESWTLPSVIPFGQYCLYGLQNLHLKLPRGL